jgi:hypothetical protein
LSDTEGRTRKLEKFLVDQSATPFHPPEGAAFPRAAYTVSEGKDIGSIAFRSQCAEAVTHEVKIGDQTIKVTLPKNPPPGTHTIEEVALALAALPPAARAQVKEVVVEPGANPDDAYWKVEYNDPSFTSYMTAGADGIISLYPSPPKPSQAYMDQSFIHETGHILSRSSWGDDSQSDPRWADWNAAVTADGIVPSGYGKKSPDEDFAETLVIYMTVRGTPQEAELRALMPERFKILDRLLGGGGA